MRQCEENLGEERRDKTRQDKESGKAVNTASRMVQKHHGRKCKSSVVRIVLLISERRRDWFWVKRLSDRLQSEYRPKPGRIGTR